MTAAFGRRFVGDWSVRLSIGGALGGDLERGARSYEVSPGVVGSATVGKRWFGRADEVPFLVTTLSFGASRATTEEVGGPDGQETIVASDLRLGAMFGMTFWEAWSPYVGGRVFAGPVSWSIDGQDVTGSDKHHYAIAAGSSVALPEGFALMVDGAFLGERSVSGGVSYEF